jgi:hypothetical protein
MKWVTLLLAMVAPIGSAAGEEPFPAAGRLTVNGTVVMPDGSPAADAVVTSRDGNDDPPTAVHTDARGRFQIQGEFAWLGCRLHARSADGKFQTTLRISEMLARKRLASPVEMKLLPAQERVVTVLANGKPVEGASVVVGGWLCSGVEGTSNAAGQVTLRFPANEPVDDMVAWQRTLGIAALGSYKHRVATSDRIPNSGVQLSLLAARPHTIRVVDADENPVPGVALSVNIYMGDHHILSQMVQGATAMTGDDGTATIGWCPQDCANVEVHVPDPRWKLDDVDRGNPTTVRVKRRTPAKGRLIMPPGVSAEGILVKGDAFGTTFCGDLPSARAAADGSFTLMAVSNHGYAVSAADSEWSSSVWTGKILGNDGDDPASIELEAYRAAPLEIVVIRGARREPVDEAWIDVCRKHEFDWVDVQGNERGAIGTFSSWIRTNARGVAQAGLGKGEYELRLHSGAWQESRKLEVTGDDALVVEFHRPWLVERQMISGRFAHDGAPYKPSPNAVLKATARAQGGGPVVIDTYLNRDGTFDIKDDTPNVSIYFVDGDPRLCGFARVGSNENSITMALSPIPIAETPELEYYVNKVAEGAIERGEPGAAVEIYDDLQVLDPDVPSTFLRRGRILAQMGKYAEALADFRQAIRLDARDPHAHNDLAWVLATCPVAEHRSGDEAFRHANAACELTEGKNPVFLSTLAAALAEQGDFAQAIKGQMKAISLAAESNKPAYEKRLALYKARQAFRDEPKLVNKSRD